jgi:hypothetical protein
MLSAIDFTIIAMRTEGTSWPLIIRNSTFASTIFALGNIHRFSPVFLLLRLTICNKRFALRKLVVALAGIA